MHAKTSRRLDDTHHMLFALGKKGAFYGKLGFEWKQYAGSYFGHGSFMGGGYLQAAGELMLVGGQLKYITSNSGHYLPSAHHMRNALYQLMKQGVDLSEVVLVLYQHNSSSPISRGRYVGAHFYNALEFLEKREVNCTRLDDRAKEYKDEIRAVRMKTNEDIARPDSLENNMPHRRGPTGPSI